MPAKSPEAIARKRANDAPKRRLRAAKLRLSVDYQQKEGIRKYRPAQENWSLGSMFLMTADGEADNDFNYDQFAVYDGENYYDLGGPGENITFTELVYWLRKICKMHKKLDKARRSNVIHMFSYHYDLDKALCNDPLLTEEEKQLITTQRSAGYGRIRPEGWQREILLESVGLAVYIGRKETSIKFMRKNEEGEYKSYYTLYIHDTFTLTAMPFLKTIKPLRDIMSLEEQANFDKLYALIEEGKAERGEWSDKFDYDMRRQYNHAELETMHYWLSHIIEGCKTMGIHPRSLAGPAPFARALIYKYGLTQHVQPRDYSTLDYQHSAAFLYQKSAYFGGRIELAGQGVLELFTELDLTMAYPANIAKMPCYAHGEWVLHPSYNKEEIQDYSIYHVTFKPAKGMTYKRRYGPMPTRAHTGTTRYPMHGNGYYYGVELKTIMAYWQVTILDWCEYVPQCDMEHPFADMVHDMYDQRQERIEAKDESASLVIKLSVNSLYGLFAQNAGAAAIVDAEGAVTRYKLPKFYNLAAAGFITAATRAALYGATMEIGEERVIGFATDAIFVEGIIDDSIVTKLQVTDKKHKQLGKFAMEIIDDPTAFVAPGIRCSKSGVISKTRGYPHAFKFDELCSEWDRDEVNILQTRKIYVDLRLSKTKMDDRGQFARQDRVAAISTGVLLTKRNVPLDALMHSVKSSGFTVFPPYHNMQDKENAPYRRRFEQDDKALAMLDRIANERDDLEI